MNDADQAAKKTISIDDPLYAAMFRVAYAALGVRKCKRALMEVLNSPTETAPGPHGTTVVTGPWSRKAMQELNVATAELDRVLDEFQELLHE